MANYGVFGFVKDQNGNPIKNASVYPYFKKVSAPAPASKWVDFPYRTDINGYFGFDLGDTQLIGTESTIVKGTDKIYLAITYNTDINDQDRNSLTFTDCLFIEHVTINADFFELNLSIEAKRLPILSSSSFPPANILTRTTYTMSETSYPDYTWKALAPYPENEISQKLLYDLVPIFDGHQLISTQYDWDEIPTREKNNSTSDSYQFDIAGVYNLCITVREKWNTQVQICQEVTVKYNKPEPDFNWTPIETNDWQGSKIKGQEEITFHNLSSDIDNRTWDSTKWGLETYTYTWTIEDTFYELTDNTQVYSNVNYSFEPTHMFQSPGIKNITLEIHWNDGFSDFTETITKQIVIEAFDIVPDFNWDKTPKHRNDVVSFNPDLTSGDTFQIKQYNWIIEDYFPENEIDMYTFLSTETSIFGEGTSDNTQNIDNTYYLQEQYPQVKFHSLPNKNVHLTITYFNGWVDVTEEIQKTISPTKYSIEPEFNISNDNPQGRFEEVIFTNTTSYIRDTYNLGYTIDWRLDDFYMSCNLNNASNIEVDNYKELVDVPKETQITHFYQNTSNNNIELEIRYDDGYQMQTKRLIKTVTPIVFEDPIPDFSWTPETPVGRHDLVTILNTTNYDETRCRGVNWIIEDFYKLCNLDNPTNEISDNTDIYTRELPTFSPTKYYQSDSTHSIDMTYFFDDGFCEQSVHIQKQITPIQFEAPTPNFIWNIQVPISREQEILFYNTTIDTNNRFRSYDWNIPDSFNLFNPENPNYGVSTTDNTQIILNETNIENIVSHYFQDNISRTITMTYHYDDGFCDNTVEISKEITFTEYTIEPSFDTNIQAINNGFFGRNEILYFNNSSGDTSRILDEKWTWNDRIFQTEEDNITTRDDQTPWIEQAFTWQSPSRKPYSATDNSISQNINKDVTLEIRIDTGWRNDTLDGQVGLDNQSDGGQVYFDISKSFEASPYEVSSNISFTCNIKNYTH